MPDRRLPSHACEDEAREALLKAREALAAAAGAAGSACLSLRWHRSGGAGMLITAPAQVPAAVLDAATIFWLPLEQRRGPLPDAPPTDEWRLHRDVYRQRTDVEAIVRCRPTYATAIACCRNTVGDGIPAFHPDVADVAGGALACVDCGPAGKSPTSEPLLLALHDRWACLLAGLGLLACGTSLAVATSRAIEVEALARIWWHVLQMGR